MAQDWETAPQTVPMSVASAMPPVHQLRPLTTGEILDSTFTLFRSRFWLFAGLASLAGAWQVVVQALQLLLHHELRVHLGARSALIATQFGVVLSVIIMLPVVAVVYAAVVYALGEVYLGRPSTAAQALRATRRKWLRYVGIALWQGWSAAWLAVLLLIPAFGLLFLIPKMPILGAAGGGLLILLAIFGGGIYGAIAYIRNSLAVPAAVVEGSAVRPSMRRSKDLAAGTKGRIFVALLVAWALYLVAVTIDAPMLFVVGRSPNEEHVLAQAVIFLVGFLSTTFISPVPTIGLTLVYFDQRVRKEAFDLQMLLGPMQAAPGLTLPDAMAVPSPMAAVSSVPVAEEPPAPPVLGAEEPLDPADTIYDDGRF
jgi:hypothetical protein